MPVRYAMVCDVIETERLNQNSIHESHQRQYTIYFISSTAKSFSYKWWKWKKEIVTQIIIKITMINNDDDDDEIVR